MLRKAVLAIGAGILVCGLIAIFVGAHSAAWACAIWGALIVAGIVFERVRYKPLESAAPGGRWVRTAERFIDDETGAPVTVYLDPETGDRKYVRE
jgi:hypothetical protein